MKNVIQLGLIFCLALPAVGCRPEAETGDSSVEQPTESPVEGKIPGGQTTGSGEDVELRPLTATVEWLRSLATSEVYTQGSVDVTSDRFDASMKKPLPEAATFGADLPAGAAFPGLDQFKSLALGYIVLYPTELTPADGTIYTPETDISEPHRGSIGYAKRHFVVWRANDAELEPFEIAGEQVGFGSFPLFPAGYSCARCVPSEGGGLSAVDTLEPIDCDDVTIQTYEEAEMLDSCDWI